MNTLEDKITVLEDDSYFQFSQISEYVTKYSAEEFLKLFTVGKNSIIDENLEIVFFEDTNICVGKNIPSFTLDWIDKEHYKDMTWGILENFIYPVYYDNEYGELDIGYNSNLWKMKFIEDYKSLHTYSISNRTDFNEKFGWYPHIKVDEDYVPFGYIGEILVKEEKAYLFFDVDYSAEFFENNDNSKFNLNKLGLNFDDLYAVIGENNLKLDSKFSKHPLSAFDKKLISSENVDRDADVLNKRFIPYDPIFNFAPNVQDYYGPEIEDLITGEWTFVYQMPIPWHGAKTIDESDLYYINEGDSGSIAVFINSNNDFRVEYSQT